MIEQDVNEPLGIPAEKLLDGTDLRDLVYQPALLPLPSTCFPESLQLGSPSSLVQIRDQGNSNRCTGYALAGVVDILRAGKSNETEMVHRPVSARMLFEMGKLVSSVGTGAAQSRLSIRSTLKGFYHNGVCLDNEWNSDQAASHLSVECAKSARKISLGTYYRLQQYLPNYHCALLEADAILVSARIHGGWSKEAVSRNGRIEPTQGEHGAHAFIIVGYDEAGFYVLNSWGADWCGEVDGKPVSGVAHWSYKDWSESIMDAWVLRLAVSTPSAFDFSIGPQGINYLGGPNWNQQTVGSDVASAQSTSRSGASSSVPRQHVVGHYVHHGDGSFVEGGSYPDSVASLETTLDYLDKKIADSHHASSNANECTRLYLRLTGDTGSVDDAMRRVAILRRRLRPQGVYPLSVVWTASLASAFTVAIKSCMSEATARMPHPSDERDDLIETLLRPIGRPLWAQLKSEADLVASESGPMQLILNSLNQTLDKSVTQNQLQFDQQGAIDLVVEGAGALVLSSVLELLGAAAPQYFRHIRRVQLSFPMVRYERLASALLRAVKNRDGMSLGFLAKFVLQTPDSSFLEHSSVGPYTRTWFHLVNNSFDSDTIGDREFNIVSLAPKAFNSLLDVQFASMKHIEQGGAMNRKSNGSARLRYYLVSEEFLTVLNKND